MALMVLIYGLTGFRLFLFSCIGKRGQSEADLQSLKHNRN